MSILLSRALTYTSSWHDMTLQLGCWDYTDLQLLLPNIYPLLAYKTATYLFLLHCVCYSIDVHIPYVDMRLWLLQLHIHKNNIHMAFAFIHICQWKKREDVRYFQMITRLWCKVIIVLNKYKKADKKCTRGCSIQTNSYKS